MMERSKCMNIPKVRFHGFKEKWKEESLFKLFVERHEISTITESLPQLSFTISEGVIYPDDRKSNKRDFLIKDILSKKYLVTYIGDILYNPANVIYGAIHRNSLCDGVVSPIYKIFKTEQDSNFMECVVRNPSFISQLSMKTEGTVTKLKTLKPRSFLEMIVKIAPSIYEQRKIASYFQTLDSLIQTTSKKLASLKQIKAASLQSMFPQEGGTVPKVRFKGFEGGWKYEILGKISSISIGEFVIQTKQRANAPYPVYNGGITNTGYYDYFNQEGPKIIISARGANAGFINKYENRFWAGNSCYSIGINNNNWEFIYYFLQSKQDSYLKEQQAANIPSISKKQIYTTNVLLPCYNEQIKIGLFFSNLDKQISLQTKRLEKLKQIKAACLDKMFV